MMEGEHRVSSVLVGPNVYQRCLINTRTSSPGLNRATRYSLRLVVERVSAAYWMPAFAGHDSMLLARFRGDVSFTSSDSSAV
jgi:hypothetical protein